MCVSGIALHQSTLAHFLGMTPNLFAIGVALGWGIGVCGLGDVECEMRGCGVLVGAHGACLGANARSKIAFVK